MVSHASRFLQLARKVAGDSCLMSKCERSSRFYGTKGVIFVTLALLMSTAVMGSARSHNTLLEPISGLFGLQASSQFNFSGDKALPDAAENSRLNVAVSLANVSSTPGIVLVPITVGDLTGQGIFSYDLQITFDPAIVTPASPAFVGPGTLSSAMAITTNATNPGHLILGAFQGSPLDGSGTLLFLRFNVIGTPGQSSTLNFEDYVGPGPAFHPAFNFNDGTPAAITTNGSISVIAGATPTNTSTSTETPTNTPTPGATQTSTSTATSTATATPTASPACGNSVSIANATTFTGVPVAVPVNVSNVAGQGAVSASFTVNYTPGLITPSGVSFGPVGISNGGGRTLSYSNPVDGLLNVSIFGGNEFQGSGALVNLNFSVAGLPGTISQLNFNSFQYNSGSPCAATTNGSVSVVSGTISGTVTYGNVMAPPAPRYVPNVLISGFGSPPVSAVTNNLGVYSIGGFGPGVYSMTPSKSGGVNGAISGFDAALVSQYVVNLTLFTPAQVAAADVSGTGGVSSFDASLIARYSAAMPQTGIAGTWIFNPPGITHPPILTNIVNENYSALLMGDVSGNWVNSGSRPANANGPEKSSAVIAPDLMVSVDSDIIIPLKIQSAAGKGIISYDFALRYDPAVIQPHADPISLNRTVSRNLSAVANTAEPGLLRVTVFGPMPIESDGTLLNLRFTAVGTAGSVSPLSLERLVLNEGDPRAVFTDGRVEIYAGSSSEAEIGGRVLTPFGEGISNARVTLTSTTGRSRSVTSNGFGAYRFAALQPGETYTIRVSSKHYTFTPITIGAANQITTQDLIAEP